MIEERKWLTPEEGEARMIKHIREFYKEKYKLVLPELWTRQQAAKFLNVSPKTVSNWLYLQKKHPMDDPFPVTRISRRAVRHLSTEVVNWAKRREIKKFSPKEQDQQGC